MPLPQTLRWRDSALELLDQRALPHAVRYVRCESAVETAAAIRTMVVRGAPAIGCAAAFGVATEAARCTTSGTFGRDMTEACSILAASRPTAVNLFWAIDRMQRRFEALFTPTASQSEVADGLLIEAIAIATEDVANNQRIGKHGAALIPDGGRILTHCNAGALATAGHGTALGVIRSARDAGKQVHVYVDETRPLLQGARLTAWELMEDGIPVTLITDGMSGALMQKGVIDVVIVGADRVASNGDTANKIGTYMVAVLAHRHHIPFYVACPESTIDRALDSGSAIPIEERMREEVAGFGSERWAPENVPCLNPAFDVTPAELITGIITENGVWSPSR